MWLNVPRAGESLSRNRACPAGATTRYVGHSKEAWKTGSNLHQEPHQAASLLLLRLSRRCPQTSKHLEPSGPPGHCPLRPTSMKNCPSLMKCMPQNIWTHFRTLLFFLSIQDSRVCGRCVLAMVPWKWLCAGVHEARTIEPRQPALGQGMQSRALNRLCHPSHDVHRRLLRY